MLAVTRKKSEKLYIIWLNVEVVYLLLQLQKVKGIAREKKSIASELTYTTKSNTFYSLSIPFTFSTVIKGIAFSIFNTVNRETPKHALKKF